MSDPIDAYLAKHKIAPMLNGIVNEMVASLPDDPISFLINGLLKEAAERKQEPALLLRLQELKQTLLKDQKEAGGVAAEKAKLEEDAAKLKYRIKHLDGALEEYEKGGAPAGGGGGGGLPAGDLGVPGRFWCHSVDSGLSGIPPGHTPFSWSAGLEIGGGGGGGTAAPAASTGAAAAPAAAAPGAGGAALPIEPFSPRVAVATLLRASEEAEGQRVSVCGWVKTARLQGKKLAFINLNDGSSITNLQLVAEKDKLDAAAWEAAKGVSNGCAIQVAGALKLSPKDGQKWELPVDSLVVTGPSDAAKYPIPPQNIKLETLRSITHMRPRTGVIGAVMRVRNALAYATHTFFQGSGFMYVHAPLITGADCEGAGEMFQVRRRRRAPRGGCRAAARARARARILPLPLTRTRARAHPLPHVCVRARARCSR